MHWRASDLVRDSARGGACHAGRPQWERDENDARTSACDSLRAPCMLRTRAIHGCDTRYAIRDATEDGRYANERTDKRSDERRAGFKSLQMAR
ncbi:hypothetical protein WS73_02545 [Burkholderia savannae]|nr:hypothetical protein WS73_02545 [Burkholderia savannae]